MKRYKYIIWIASLMLAMPLAAQTDSTNCPKDTVNGEIVYKYQVEKSIGLYRIGINFNVSQSEIVRMNPQLKERGLRYGETIMLPTGRKVQNDEKTIPSLPIGPDATIVVADSVVADSNTTSQMRTIELALMLPFESGQAKQTPNGERMIAFYQGALLALHEKQDEQMQFRLRVYDTGRSERVVYELCDSTELDSVQAIFGLAYPIQVERVAAWCQEHHVPLLVPFVNDLDIALQENVLQFNISEQQAADSLCAWMQAHENLHCIAIETAESETASSLLVLRDEMKKRGIAYRRIPMRDLMNDSAAYALDITKENLFILHSDRYQQVRLLLSHLEKMRKAGYRIRVVGQYSWQKENIGLPLVYTSVFTADTDRTVYEALWKRYYANGFVSETPRYDLLGYDLMNTLLDWLDGKQQHYGLQSYIRWQHVEHGGWQNIGIQVIIKD